MVGLVVGKQMVPPINRPNIYRGRLGESIFAGTGLALTAMMLFFGFRLFWDNGFWGFLQLVIISAVGGFLANLRWLQQNGLTPILCTGLGVAQAIKIF